MFQNALRNYKLKNFDVLLVFAVMAVTFIGILVIGSANEDNQQKQILGMVLGLIAMLIVSLFDYTFLEKLFPLYYVAAIGVLILVLIPGIGYTVSGATRWIPITDSFRIQPSEMAKILLVLFFAKFLSMIQENLNRLLSLAATAVLAGIPLFLIYREPDLSTTIVTFLMIAAMLFVAGLDYRIVGAVLGIVIPVAVIAIVLILRGYPVLSDYQNLRILSWLRPSDYPGTAYQQQNSIMAIGSGMLMGKGLNNTAVDSVKNGNYISEPHTDFIFAVAGEELGFIGSTVIVILLMFISLRCFMIARQARDLTGRLICCGIGALIGFQSFVNICVVSGLMPNTGLTLPFVSYGLTSLVTIYAGIGFVLNVGLQSNKR